MRIEISEKQPLADKIRPQTLNEFVGQSHLLERIAAFASGPRLPGNSLVPCCMNIIVEHT